MGKVFATFKAVVTRIIFSAHGFLAIWQVAQSKLDPVWWTLCVPIGLLVLEAIFTLTIKKNQEWRWFCPSVFLYLISVVPAIWLLELDKMERRLVKDDDLALRPPNFKDLDKILGNQFKLPEIRVDSGTWITLIEQFLMLILIIGRWLLPKGDLTRDQLSQLLLVYIGTAADIIEFFDSFKDSTIANDRLLVFLTLGIWSWSLLQFTIVLSATRARKPRGGGTFDDNYSKSGNCCCTIDAWGICLNIILQDAPFLAFRMLIIIDYKIITYMNVFFACKNTLVIMLQLYRLLVVHAESKKAHKLAKAEMYTISGSVSRKQESSSTRRIKSTHEDKKKQQKKRTARRKNSGYSTDTSESSSPSASSSSVAVPVKKGRRIKPAVSKSSQKSLGSSKRKEGKRQIETSKGQKKKKPEMILVEEGSISDGNSVSVSEVVEVVKEKKRKSRKHHRRVSSGSNNSD